MAKKYFDLIQKADCLIDGMKANLERLQGKGIDQEFIKKLEADNSLHKQYNNEYDKLKIDFKSKTYQINRHHDEVNKQVKLAKKTIKSNFPKEQWLNFGIMDKK